MPPSDGHSRPPAHDVLTPPGTGQAGVSDARERAGTGGPGRGPGGSRGPGPGWRPSAGGPAHTKKLFVILAVALAATVVVLYQAARFVNHSPGKVNLGDRTLRIRGATRFGERLLRDTPAHGPVLLSDLVSDGRDLYLARLDANHWAVYAAAVNGDRRCTLVWSAPKKVLVDPCSKTEVPLDGGTQQHYSWEIVGNDVLVIDPRVAVGPPASTVAPG